MEESGVVWLGKVGDHKSELTAAAPNLRFARKSPLKTSFNENPFDPS
jgi:hypothetical protein